jgi:hypothetical protein
MDTETDTKEQEQWRISKQLFNIAGKHWMQHQLIIQTGPID